MSWSKQVWEKSSRIFKAITEQPFIKELANGSLDNQKFNRYLAQDEVYIGNYGRQMFQLADRMENAEEREMFRLFAQSGIDSEKAMHELLISRFGVDTEVKASPVTATYNAHTQHAVDCGSVEEALAAMMPCMWIYNRVGLYILSIAKLEGNPYREWIEEYGNEEFTQGVNAVVELADRWAEKAGEAVRLRMTDAYLEAALYEYAFWDYGYYGETKTYEYMNDYQKWI